MKLIITTLIYYQKFHKFSMLNVNKAISADKDYKFQVFSLGPEFKDLYRYISQVNTNK